MNNFTIGMFLQYTGEFDVFSINYLLTAYIPSWMWNIPDGSKFKVALSFPRDWDPIY